MTNQHSAIEAVASGIDLGEAEKLVRQALNDIAALSNNPAVQQSAIALLSQADSVAVSILALETPTAEEAWEVWKSWSWEKQVAYLKGLEDPSLVSAIKAGKKELLKPLYKKAFEEILK